MLTFLSFVYLIVRIGVAFYLYQEARDKNLPVDWIWIVLGLFEPIWSLMLFYVAIYLIPYVKQRN